MKRERILLIAAIAIVLIIGIYALYQKKANTQKERIELLEKQYVDSLKNVIDSIELQFNDSLLILDAQIESLNDKLAKTQVSKIQQKDLRRLEALVDRSKQITQKNQQHLLKLKSESLESEYTPVFFADLIESLIENIQQKQLRINELKEEVSALNNEINQLAQKNTTLSETNIALQNMLTVFKGEIENIKAANQSLLTVKYIVGERKELLNKSVLKRILFRKECLKANDIPDSIFQTFELTRDHIIYSLNKKVEANAELLFSPLLAGAESYIENDTIKIKITNPFEFVKTGPFVVYY